MKIRKSWEVGPVAASLWLASACATTETGTTDGQAGSPATATTGTQTGAKTGMGTTGSTSTQGAAGKMAGTAGTTGSATSPGTSGSAGMMAMFNLPKAVAKLAPFMSAGTMSAGAAGSSGAAGSGSAGAGSASGKAGLSGTATFQATRAGVDLTIDVMGCEDGKLYPVHIHEGSSCDSVMSQGPHWGAPATPTTAAAGASGGSAGSSAGKAGASGAAAGAAGAAGSSMPMLKYRGEEIPDIKCTGNAGKTSHSRSTPDVRLAWSVTTKPDTDVVGHVLVVHDPSGARIACGKIELQP